MTGWVYMMTNRPLGERYAGVTNDSARRAWEHKRGLAPAFTARYRLTRLVNIEQHEDIRNAINRETRFRHWPRRGKPDLIEGRKAFWDDQYRRLTA